MIWGMTQLDAIYRYEYHPSEAVMFALGKMREVYGIRAMKLDPEQRTILVEYDATRLTNMIVAELLRRAGLSIEEELSLIPPQLPAEAAAPRANQVATLSRDTGQETSVARRAGISTLSVCASACKLVFLMEFAVTPESAPIAQLDRAIDYESIGRRFESFWARHLINNRSSQSRNPAMT